MPKIMIIRHAEKPVDGGPDRGVNIDGFHAKHELTVRGWQRAAALLRFFAPVVALPEGSLIATPRTIFASVATLASPSLRAQHTVRPLAEMLGITINLDHAEGDEAGLAAAARAAPAPVLIAWHHHIIPALARMIGGTDLACPEDWPDDRFDMVWVLDQGGEGGDAGPWRFSQVPQRLFAHDRAEAIYTKSRYAEPVEKGPPAGQA